MNGEREKILGRVREALREKAHLPGSHSPGMTTTAHSLPRQWLPRVSGNVDEQMALFARNAADLKADFQLLGSVEAMRVAIIKLRDVENWHKVACHSGDLTNAVCPMLNVPLLHTNHPYDVHALEACDAGISECDAIIAQTGTVLVTTRSAGGRALSVLPPHHVVLVRRDQLVPDLPAAFELLKQKYAGDYPSMISFITGPSRTGDIERILVLGAHGPKKLTILCC